MSKLPSCATECKREKKPCQESSCRHWINYEGEQNCSLISIEENGPMTLTQVAERLELSFVRIAQIEKAAISKMKKRMAKN